MSQKARQGAQAGDPREWTWVEATVWTERMLAALGNGVQGGKWFSLIDKVYARSTLRAAWERVARNKGSAGVDQVSVERFRANEEQYLEEISQALRSGRYQPEAVRRVHIPKGPGETRPLGIPTVKDRVVQAALKLVLEPIFEWEFEPTSYGFRPGRGCKDALREVDRLLKEGYTWVVDADIRSYYDSIPQGAMLERIKERVSDGKVLELVEAFVHQDVLEGMARWTPTAGTPQGAVLSPLLANVYLHPLDQEMAQAGYRMVRYADDFVIVCRSQAEAERALARVRGWCEANGLSLHPDKTHVGNCLEAGQGFEFLGYRFETGRRWVRRKSLKALRTAIRAKTKRTRGQSLERIIADVNVTLRGWFDYFQHADGWTFRPVDGLVRRRLRAILRKQKKKPGRGQCRADHQRWPNAFFAKRGLFTLVEAHAAASQSR